MVKTLCQIQPWRRAGKGFCWIFIVGIVGCASPAPEDSEVADFQRERAQESRVQDLNEQLAVQSQVSEAPQDRPPDSYRLGSGDLVEIVVLGAPELNRKVRVDGSGSIGLPLIGEVSVGGLTIDEASREVAKRYEESYIRNPQVSVLVEEYRSRQITVLGAVKNPQVYPVQRNMTLLGTLAMAGGVTDEAGNTVYLTDWVTDPETKNKTRRNVVLNLDELVSNQNESNLELGSDAVVNVPSAGVVYVEGAVKTPGAYDLHGDTTVLKAIAMAGGVLFEAEESGLKLLRLQKDGEFKPEQFDLDALRQDPGNDIALKDGDIVVVETDSFKYAMKTFFDATRGFFGFGYSLNR